jgi:hypothetical protein
VAEVWTLVLTGLYDQMAGGGTLSYYRLLCTQYGLCVKTFLTKLAVAFVRDLISRNCVRSRPLVLALHNCESETRIAGKYRVLIVEPED